MKLNQNLGYLLGFYLLRPRDLISRHAELNFIFHIASE
jgi:hypothetical protein